MNKDVLKLFGNIEVAKFIFERKYTVVQIESEFSLEGKGYSKTDVIDVSNHYLDYPQFQPRKYLAIRSLRFETVDKVKNDILKGNLNSFTFNYRGTRRTKIKKFSNTVLKTMNKDEEKLRQAILNAKKEFEKDYTIVYVKGDFDEHVYSENDIVELSPLDGYSTYNRDEIILGVKSKDFYAVWGMLKHITDAKFSFTCGRMIIDSNCNMEKFDKNLFVKHQDSKVVIPDVGEGGISSIITDDKYPLHVTIETYYKKGNFPQVLKFKLSGVAENLNLTPEKLRFKDAHLFG